MSARDELLVTTDWLAGHLDDPALRVFDTTVHLRPLASGGEVRSAHEDYLGAHVPGAGFLDVGRDLSDPGAPLAFTRPPPEALARTLGRAGISNASRVVFYSATSPMWATRAWWLLRALGHPNAAILDGGLAKWRAEGRPVAAGEASYRPATFEPAPEDALWATRADVEAALADGGTCTLDALPGAIHRGETDLGYARAGHIRGSVNVPFTDLIERESGVLVSDAALREHFARAGVLERERVITYCGGAIAATLNAFALTVLGHRKVAVYDGSLDEWSRDPSLPMQTGESSP